MLPPPPPALEGENLDSPHLSKNLSRKTINEPTVASPRKRSVRFDLNATVFHEVPDESLWLGMEDLRALKTDFKSLQSMYLNDPESCQDSETVSFRGTRTKQEAISKKQIQARVSMELMFWCGDGASLSSDEASSNFFNTDIPRDIQQHTQRSVSAAIARGKKDWAEARRIHRLSIITETLARAEKNRFPSAA